MTQTNDVELAALARKVQAEAAHIDRVMASGSLNAVITLAAMIEDAARKLGWQAVRMQK